MKKNTTRAAQEAAQTVTATPADTTAAINSTTTPETVAPTASAPRKESTRKPRSRKDKPAPEKIDLDPDMVAVSTNADRVLDPVTVTDAEGVTKRYIFVTPANREALFFVAAMLDNLRAGKRIQWARLVALLYIVHHHNTKDSKSKLAGLDSVSTCCLDNPLCAALRKIQGSICAKCYAATQQARQAELTERNIINGLILRNFLIPRKYLALLPFNPLADFIRIESFGDVANITQARNYARLMKAHRGRHFGVWSKHWGIWSIAFAAEGGKPKNCSFVYSSLYIDTPAEVFPEVDHTFTVFTREAITRDGIEINCGGKSCAECIRARRGCYYKPSARNPIEIREQLKEPETVYTV